MAEQSKGSNAIAPIDAALYDVIVEKQNRASRQDTQQGVLIGPTGSISDITIAQMLQNVKDSDGNPYLQEFKGIRQGAITFAEDGQAIIQILKNANPTTALHELAHLFLRNMEVISTMDESMIP